MSLHPQTIPAIPEETARVAHAVLSPGAIPPTADLSAELPGS